jgi:protein-S-isoprenylcysteine O-methyltransferase Ste14
MACGVALRHTAVRTLGVGFVTEFAPLRNARLLQTGVYAYVRHPSETGLLSAVLGAALLLNGSGAVMLWLVGLLPLTLRRTWFEERKLRERFGADYASYARRVKRFIPFVV